MKKIKFSLGILSIIAFVGHPYGFGWNLWGITSFKIYNFMMFSPFTFYNLYSLVAFVVFIYLFSKEKKLRGWMEFWLFSALIIQPFFNIPEGLFDYGLANKIMSKLYLFWAIILFISASVNQKLEIK